MKEDDVKSQIDPKAGEKLIPPPSANPNAPHVETEAELADKREKAKLAMAGPERIAKLEEEDKAKAVAGEKAKLEARLIELTKEKEKLEVAWVEADERKGAVKKTLDPIIEEENKIEAAETEIEAQEKNMGIAREKQKIEVERRSVEDNRRKIEEEKWKVEEKLWKIEEEMDEDTKKYRALLDEEEQINARLEELKKEVI